MSGALLLTLALASSATPARSGLSGLGLGLEVPLVGIATGVGTRSHLGWGYTLGGALSWEATPHILLRLGGASAQTFGARAPVRYLDSQQTVTSRVNADWAAFELFLGGAYLWNEGDRPWTPFAGADVGATFAGFNYALKNDLATLKTQGDPSVFDPTPTQINDSARVGWEARLRGGVRLSLLRWLQTIAELSLTYMPAAAEPVSNTVTSRTVRSAPEHWWIVRATFAVRLGV